MSEGKAKFTKGPWEAYVAESNGVEYLAIAVGGLETEQTNKAIAVITPTDAMTDEDIANAAFIATAPDMYAALENCERYLVEKGCSHEYPVLKGLRAALAKARGEAV